MLQLLQMGGGIVRSLLGFYSITDYLKLSEAYAFSTGINKRIYKIFLRKIGAARGLCIENFEKIGKNLTLPHGINIVINPESVIGNNCTIYQGVTLGVIHDGRRKGCPRIDDNVTIGPNAVIVGGVTIGHHSIIAGNAFINFDVPPYSKVIGNPGTIHSIKK